MKKSHEIVIEYKCEVKRVIKKEEYAKEKKEIEDWPIYVELTNGKIYGCNFVVSATGVLPSVDIFTKNNQVQ